MTTDDLQITRFNAALDERFARAALTLVFCRLPDEAADALRLATIAEARRLPEMLETLWFAGDGRTIVGATWAQLSGGSVAQIWPPQWLPGRRPAGPDPLLVGLLADLPGCGVSFAQSLLPDVDDPDAQALREAGFLHAADLRYLAADVVGNAAAQHPTSLHFHRYESAQRERFAAIVEKSYEATLDCPTLNGLRPIDEVLAEYAEVGAEGTHHWYRVQHDSVDVGCLLLADHPTQNQVELVYMAVLPQARGKKFGRELVGETLRIAADLHRERVVLAVDARNLPAAAHYEAAGFREWERRSAFVRKLESPR
jgi:ribosomal protein S18 acetylase RimI-like enzyme